MVFKNSSSSQGAIRQPPTHLSIPPPSFTLLLPLGKPLLCWFQQTLQAATLFGLASLVRVTGQGMGLLILNN